MFLKPSWSGGCPLSRTGAVRYKVVIASARTGRMPAPVRTIETTLTEQLKQLRSELGKDAIFFGGTGMLIGLLHLSEFKMLGSSAGGARLSDDLIGDYISFTALAFQMLGCMLVGGVIGLMRSVAPMRAVLLGLYDHVRMRLLQVASPMICISVGISITSSAHYVRTGSGQGLALAVLLLLLTLYIVTAYVMPAFLDPRVDWSGPRRKPWVVPLLTIGLSLAGILFLVHAIPAHSRQTDTTRATACDQTVLASRR